MAIKVQGQTVVGDDRKGSFQVSNPGSFTTAQRDALSAVAGDQIFNTDTNKLQIYNGSQWEAAGGASTSPPSINNVVLTEDDTGGNRFTSESFTASIDMLDDGAPVSQKGIKGKVIAEFEQFPSTTPINDNNNSVWSGGGYSIVTSTQNTYNSIRFPVNEPDRKGYLSYSKYYNSSSEPGNWYFDSEISATYPSSSNTIEQVSFAPSPYNVAIVPPSDNNAGVTLYSIWDNGSAVIGYWNLSGVFTTSRLSPCGPIVRDMTTSTGDYYKIDGNSDSSWSIQRTDKMGGGSPTYSILSNNVKTSTSAYDTSPTFAVGNGKVLGAGRRQSGEDYRPFIWTLPTTFNVNQTPSTYNFGLSSNRSINWIKFEVGYFWITDNSILYRSATGNNGDWTTVSTTFQGTTYYPIDLNVDPISGNLVALLNSSNSYIMLQSNNFGSTWTLYDNLESNTSWRHIMYGNNKVLVHNTIRSDTNTPSFKYAKLRTQSITVESTGGDYSQFNVGDLIKPSNSNDAEDQGVIESISGTTFGVDSQYLYKVGDVIEAINTTGTAVSTRFLIIDVTGSVTSTQGSDPGFTQLGPGSTQQITFPATFPTGNSPDVELPAGTTLQVEIEATNSSASDTYPSNIITPA